MTGTRASAFVTLTSSQQTLLKWFAIALMLLDHANRTLWVFQSWAFALGRIAFPLFAFLIAYNITVRGVRPGRYVLPLLVFGLISQIPAMLALGRGVLPLNIFFTLLLGVGLLRLRQWLLAFLPGGWMGALLSRFLVCYLLLLFGIIVEFGPSGALLIPTMMLYLQRSRWLTGILAAFCLIMINGVHLASVTALLAAPVIYAVSRLKLPDLPRLKWFTYVFYPLHLSILWLLDKTLG